VSIFLVSNSVSKNVGKNRHSTKQMGWSDTKCQDSVGRRSRVGVIIVTCNSQNFIGPCISSLEVSGVSIVVIDNCSTDGTKDIIREHPDVRLIEAPANLGYGRALNLAVAEAGSNWEYVVLSNADVVYQADTISILISLLKSDPTIGIVAPQQISTSGGWQVSYADAPGVWSGAKDVFGVNSMSRWYRRLRWPHQVDRQNKDVAYLAGAVLALPVEAFRQVNGFDESFQFYAEDADLCIRLRNAGRRVVFCSRTAVIHHEGAHSAKTDQAEQFCRLLTTSVALLAAKHLPQWKARIYLRLRSTYYKEVATIFRVIKLFAPETRKSQLSRKIRISDVYSRLSIE
jgi:N-acetylglucosaminyl-diphospho-decaprenol L-rhamnosyltransferase